MSDFEDTFMGDLWSPEEAKAMDDWCEAASSNFLSVAEKQMMRAKYGIIFQEDSFMRHSDYSDEYHSVNALDYNSAKQALDLDVSISPKSKFVQPDFAACFKDYLNKPLPPIPGPEVDDKCADISDDGESSPFNNSIDNLTYDESDDGNEDQHSLSSPPNLDPLTPPGAQNTDVNIDMTAIAQLSFMQAGIHLDTKDIVDNHFAALGTGLEGNLDIDEVDQLEKEEASAGFYGGFKVEESPSPFHAPIIDEDNGYGDIREGAEDFPELWTFDEKQPKVYPLAEVEALEYEAAFGHTLPREKVVLQPKSQKAKLQDDVNFVFDASVYIPKIQKKTLKACANGNGYFSSKAKKRAAQDCFTSRSNSLTLEDYSDEHKYLSTKRIRVAAGNHARTSIPSPTYSLITNSDEDDCKETIAVDVEQILQSNATVDTSCKGFHGQFSIFDIADGDPSLLNELNNHQKGISSVTFGDQLHPNYLYVNTGFVLDPRFPAVQYTVRNLQQYGTTHWALMRASDLTDHAASDTISKLRTVSQENLRKESHAECSSAGLEGVSVGRYRYYQGHLSVEEYNQARMCVCWEMCSCSKMCTRYGDLICPCAQNIAIQKI